MSRLDVRISDEIKETYEQAADTLGVSLTDFIKSAAMEKAQQVLSQHKYLMLAKKDWDNFVKALESPQKPNKALRDAVKFYKNSGMK